MRIVDEALLADVRQRTHCEWCKKRLKHDAHPHHIFARGMGGGMRLDVTINLIALGGPGDCNCHGQVHAGHILRCDLLLIVAARERMGQDEIEREIYRLRREPKARA